MARYMLPMAICMSRLRTAGSPLMAPIPTPRMSPAACPPVEKTRCREWRPAIIAIFLRSRGVSYSVYRNEYSCLDFCLGRHAHEMGFHGLYGSYCTQCFARREHCDPEKACMHGGAFVATKQIPENQQHPQPMSRRAWRNMYPMNSDFCAASRPTNHAKKMERQAGAHLQHEKIADVTAVTHTFRQRVCKAGNICKAHVHALSCEWVHGMCRVSRESKAWPDIPAERCPVWQKC